MVSCLYIIITEAILMQGVTFSLTLLKLPSSEISENPFLYLFYAVLAVAVVYLLVKSQVWILSRTRKLLKEKELALAEVARQREELVVKNKNITDSLIYAQRIQNALLPSPQYLRNNFSESFILFSPKDIVSGDFYWISSRGDKVFIAAADCTGHGVPGALVSMIGMEILEKTINQDAAENPSEILGKLSRGIEKAFSREKNDGSVIRDSMDIGLCVIDKKENRLEYSGAFLPLYLIRDEKLIELKGDKLPIGITSSTAGYVINEQDLMPEDVVYMFTDGYVDQFGGDGNKKFMYRRFRYLLLSIYKFPMEDQKTILEENMKKWIGENEQIDDMLVIGFRPFQADF